MNHARKCLDEIVELYRSGSDEKTPELLERVADLYFLTLEQQSRQDREAFDQAMARMARAAGPLARARLAERIASAELAPQQLLQQLARDEILIARPVLQYSPCLREGDLVSITSEAEQGHLLATAHRRDLTRPVTDILVKRGEPAVLTAVVCNAGAQLSRESLARINEAAGLDNELSRALHMRRDLAPSPLGRLKRLAATQFWHNVAETLLMTDERSSAAQPGATPKPLEKTPPAAPAATQRKRKPSPEPVFNSRSPAAEKVLVDAARAGKVRETVEAFARIARLDFGMIEHCMFQAQIPALMVLCKAHRLAPSTFTALVQLRESCTGEPVSDTVGLIRRYEGMTPDTAQRIIRFSDKRRQIDGEEEENAEDVPQARLETLA